MKKLILILFAGLTILSGCAGTDKYTPVDYSILGGGSWFVKYAPGAAVFNSKKEYYSFLTTRAISRSRIVDKFDFSKNSMLAAFIGKEAAGGFGLRVKNVTEIEKMIIVTAEKVKGAEPVYLISIPKTDKQARLILEK